MASGQLRRLTVLHHASPVIVTHDRPLFLILFLSFLNTGFKVNWAFLKQNPSFRTGLFCFVFVGIISFTCWTKVLKRRVPPFKVYSRYNTTQHDTILLYCPLDETHSATVKHNKTYNISFISTQSQRSPLSVQITPASSANTYCAI